MAFESLGWPTDTTRDTIPESKTGWKHSKKLGDAFSQKRSNKVHQKEAQNERAIFLRHDVQKSTVMMLIHTMNISPKSESFTLSRGGKSIQILYSSIV